MKFLLILFALLFAVTAKPKACEKIKIPICRDIGYNNTALPNYANQKTQADAEFSLHNLNPIIRSGCSHHMRLFVCAVYLPMCYPGVEKVGPCRGLCERARDGCSHVMQKLGYTWPKELDCAKFHHEGDYEHMCIMSNAV